LRAARIAATINSTERQERRALAIDSRADARLARVAALSGVAVVLFVMV
jgi:hypothetical protein